MMSSPPTATATFSLTRLLETTSSGFGRATMIQTRSVSRSGLRTTLASKRSSTTTDSTKPSEAAASSCTRSNGPTGRIRRCAWRPRRTDRGRRRVRRLRRVGGDVRRSHPGVRQGLTFLATGEQACSTSASSLVKVSPSRERHHQRRAYVSRRRETILRHRTSHATPIHERHPCNPASASQSYWGPNHPTCRRRNRPLWRVNFADRTSLSA